MERILEIASQVSTPLALAGFFAAALFLVFRQIVAKNIFPRLTAAVGATLLKQIIDRLFVLALVAMLLGFAGYLLPQLLDAPESRAPADSPDRGAQAEAIGAIARSQLESRDYAGAWRSVEEGLQQTGANAPLEALQAEIAMRWTRDLSVPEGRTFTEVVAALQPVLYRHAQRHREARPVAAADALAHIGWANYLRHRDGERGIDIDGKYREALALDPGNPFAHAMWGHWLVVSGAPLAESRAHFDAALAGGREREFVRRWQIAALRWGPDENSLELIRVCDAMRRNGEPRPEADTRRRLLSHVYFGDRRAVLAQLNAVLPADAHLATFRWLTEGIDPRGSVYQTFFLARLTEAAGDCAEARRIYLSLSSPGTTMDDEIQAGLARCERALAGAEPER